MKIPLSFFVDLPIVLAGLSLQPLTAWVPGLDISLPPILLRLKEGSQSGMWGECCRSEGQPSRRSPRNVPGPSPASQGRLGFSFLSTSRVVTETVWRSGASVFTAALCWGSKVVFFSNLWQPQKELRASGRAHGRACLDSVLLSRCVPGAQPP